MASKTGHRPHATRSERRRAAVQRRRELATARSTAARRAVRRRRRLRLAAVVAALAVVGGTITFLATRPEELPSPELRADLVPGAVGTLAIDATPTSYHAVYRAETYEGSKVTVTTEEIEVRRPFDGRVFIREGEPPGGTVRFHGRSNLDRYANYAESGAGQVSGNAATVALGDIRVANALAELVGRGLFVPGARRQALGRQCQVYRTGSPLQSLKITAPTDTDYVDTCLDAAGLILEEVTVTGGKLSQRLTATALDLDAAIDPAAFAIEGAAVGPDQGGAEVTEVDRAAAPTPGFWAADAPPAGFTHRARYQVRAQEGTSHVDVYVRGTDLVTVRQGAPSAEPDVSDAGPGRDADLGPLGSGSVVIASTGTTVIAHPASEAFVHVAGTVAPAEVQAFAAGLRRS